MSTAAVLFLLTVQIQVWSGRVCTCILKQDINRLRHSSRNSRSFAPPHLPACAATVGGEALWGRAAPLKLSAGHINSCAEFDTLTQSFSLHQPARDLATRGTEHSCSRSPAFLRHLGAFRPLLSSSLILEQKLDGTRAAAQSSHLGLAGLGLTPPSRLPCTRQHV